MDKVLLSHSKTLHFNPAITNMLDITISTTLLETPHNERYELLFSEAEGAVYMTLVFLLSSNFISTGVLFTHV